MQVERAAKEAKDTGPKYTELVRENEEEKLQLQLQTTKPAPSKPSTSAVATNVFKTVKKDWDTMSVKSYKSTTSLASEGKRKLSALEQIREEQERMKQKRFRKDYWLTEVSVAVICDIQIFEYNQRLKSYF